MASRRALVAIAWSLVIAAAGAPALGQGRPVVGPEPEELMIELGGTGASEIGLRDVVDLYGADVRLSFDPHLVQVVDADPRADGVQVEPVTAFLGPDLLLRNVVDNQAGTIWYAAAHVYPRRPVSGSGVLARVTFRAVVPGTSPLTVTYRKLGDQGGAEIPADARDGRIVVTLGGRTAVPTETPIHSPTPGPSPTPTVTPTPYYGTPGASATTTPSSGTGRTIRLPFLSRTRRR